MIAYENISSCRDPAVDLRKRANPFGARENTRTYATEKIRDFNEADPSLLRFTGYVVGRAQKARITGKNSSGSFG